MPAFLKQRVRERTPLRGVRPVFSAAARSITARQVPSPSGEPKEPNREQQHCGRPHSAGKYELRRPLSTAGPAPALTAAPPGARCATSRVGRVAGSLGSRGGKK